MASGRLSNLKRRVKRRVRGRGDDDDRRVDLLEARKERARRQARREARKEKRQQQIEQARESARQEVLSDEEKQSRSLVDQISSVLATDHDGDGEPLIAEMGADTQRASVGRDRALNRELQALEDEVEQVGAQVQGLESEVEQFHGGATGGRSGQQEEADPFGGDPFGDEEAQLEAMGFDVGGDN